jgi:hypothetical protein
MPRGIKTIKKNIKGGDNEISTVKNFTSSRSPSSVNILGSSPRSSEGIKAQAPVSASQASAPASASQASASQASASQASASQAYTNKPSSSKMLTVPAAATAVVTAISSVKPTSGSSLFRYIIIFVILAFLGVTLFLYLEKPTKTSITHLYDPIFKFFGYNDTNKNNKVAIKKLEKTLNERKVVNNIDGKAKAGAGTAGTAETDTSSTTTPTKENKYKRKPVIPKADDYSMNPKSQAGYCYIGEDRGYRSCIEVGEGDVCMSGDIFPTQAVCINPKLRE